jgi:hypothetical protein
VVVVLPSVGVSVWFELHTVVFFSWMDGWMDGWCIDYRSLC